MEFKNIGDLKEKNQQVQQYVNINPQTALDISFEEPSSSRQLLAGESLRYIAWKKMHYKEIKAFKGKQKMELTFTPNFRNILAVCQSLWFSTKTN